MEKNIKIETYKENRTIILSDEINHMTVSDIENKIQEIILDDKKIYSNNIINISQLGNDITDIYKKQNKFPPIELVINSPGGSVYSGLGLYDFICNINKQKQHKIEITLNGSVASMATIIMLASDVRKSYKNTSFLVHSIFSMSFGKIQELRDDLKETNRLNRILHNIYLEKTKITKELLDKIDREKIEYWINAEEALNLGLITEIIY